MNARNKNAKGSTMMRAVVLALLLAFVPAGQPAYAAEAPDTSVIPVEPQEPAEPTPPADPEPTPPETPPVPPANEAGSTPAETEAPQPEEAPEPAKTLPETPPEEPESTLEQPPEAPEEEGAVDTAENSESDFDFDPSTGHITAYLGDDIDVAIPESIDGVTVKGISDDWVFSPWECDTKIETIELPTTIEYIGEMAFYGCEYLFDITFLGEAPELGWGAFQDVEYATFRCHVDYEDDYDALLDEYLGYFTGNRLETFGTPTNPTEPEPEGDDFAFAPVKGGTAYAVTDYLGKGGAVTLPATYKEKPVVGIAENAFNSMGESDGARVARLRAITSITLPDSITYIETWALANLINMESLTLGASVESIGFAAFQYAHKLQSVAIPASATDIDNEAFVMCNALQRFEVAEGNPNYKDIDGVLFSKDGTSLISYPGGRGESHYAVPAGTVEIAPRAFKMDHQSTASGKLAEVSYPESLRKIGDGAFFGCSLRRVTIFGNIEMGTNVYDGSRNITEVVVAEGVTQLSKGLFYGLENCEKVTLPSTLRKIGPYAFDRLAYSKPALEMTLPEGLEEIGEDAFVLANIVDLVIPSTVTTIGPRAFYLCKKLESLSFAPGSAITSIGAYAFNHCTNLASVQLPQSVTTLETGSFSHCYALKGIELPSGITTLENTVFAGSGLESIQLPASITTMGSAVFRDCTSLLTAALPAKLQKLGTCTFENCFNLTTVDFPATMQLQSLPVDTFFQCEGLQYIYLPASVQRTEACSFANCSDSLLIEYANANLQRSWFDVCQINPGTNYELRTDGTYWTTEAVTDQDNSGGVMDELGELTPEDVGTGSEGPSGRAASSGQANCGCSTGGTVVQLNPSCDPTFRHKPAESGQGGTTPQPAQPTAPETPTTPQAPATNSPVSGGAGWAGTPTTGSGAGAEAAPPAGVPGITPPAGAAARRPVLNAADPAAETPTGQEKVQPPATVFAADEPAEQDVIVPGQSPVPQAAAPAAEELQSRFPVFYVVLAAVALLLAAGVVVAVIRSRRRRQDAA